MSIGSRLCWNLKVSRVWDRRPLRLRTNVNLRQVIAAHRAKVHGDLKPSLAQDLRQIGTELGEHGVSEVASRMANPQSAVVEGAFGIDLDPRKVRATPGTMGTVKMWRPPGTKTRRISARAVARSGTCSSVSEVSTRSKLASG